MLARPRSDWQAPAVSGDQRSRLRRAAETPVGRAAAGIAVMVPLHELLLREGWLRALLFALLITAVVQVVGLAERSWRRRHPLPPEHAGEPGPGAVAPMERPVPPS